MEQHVEVNQSPEQGRHLSVKHKTQAGTVLVCEYPLVAVLDKNCLKSHCSFCLRQAIVSQCSRCKSVAYCSTQCQKKDWTMHSKECKYSAQETPLIRALCRLVHSNPLTFLFESFVSNRLNLSQDQLLSYAPHVATLKKILGPLLPSAQATLDLISLFLSNSMCVSDGEGVNIGVALYKVSSWVNSQCVPNACVVFDGRIATMRCIRDMEMGEQIFISYVVSTLSRSARKLHLKNYFFNCKCHLCTADLDPLDGFICKTTGCSGDLDLDSWTCRVCRLEVKSWSNSNIDEKYILQKKILTNTHALLFETRDALIHHHLALQNLTSMIHVALDQIEAYTQLFGPLHPLVSVNLFLVFKAALSLGIEARGYGQTCVSSLSKTHGVSHEMYKDALKMFNLLMAEMEWQMEHKFQ